MQVVYLVVSKLSSSPFKSGVIRIPTSIDIKKITLAEPLYLSEANAAPGMNPLNPHPMPKRMAPTINL